MAEVVRLTEVRQEIWETGREEYGPERYANHDERYADYITVPAADAGQTYQTVHTIVVPVGKILNLMNLRFFGWDAADIPLTKAILEVRQTGGPVSSSDGTTLLFGLADGIVDLLVPGSYAGTLENPLAKLQGVVTFRILAVDATAEYLVVIMGDEFSPQPQEHYAHLAEEGH